MSSNSEISNDDWRSASRKSLFRWPLIVAVSGAIVCLLNMIVRGNHGLRVGSIRFTVFDAFCIFCCFLVSTAPVWYYATSWLVDRKIKVSIKRQILAFLALLIFAVLLAPQFGVEHRDYDGWSDTDRRDVTTILVKRSLIQTLRTPTLALDELTWLQNNFSSSYIPAGTFCAKRTSRAYPFFGITRDDDLANALASGGWSGSDEGTPPVAVLENAIARCNREGPAMLAAGHTKESALLRDDVDLFFTLDALGESPNSAIVLEDAQMPAPIMAKVESSLKKADGSIEYLSYLDDGNYDPSKGQVRRLRALALAAALGRPDDVARLSKFD